MDSTPRGFDPSVDDLSRSYVTLGKRWKTTPSDRFRPQETELDCSSYPIPV
jgi:hypothetical protein